MIWVTALILGKCKKTRVKRRVYELLCLCDNDNNNNNNNNDNDSDNDNDNNQQ